MRIVHISDIHLSKDNYGEFEKNYRDDFLKVLEEEHGKRKIDIIAITGDLVDQGGHSLYKLSEFSGYTDPYKFFEDVFITPIKEALNLKNENFLFIPGNHDIDENEILWVDEKQLQDDEVKGKTNSLLDDMSVDTNKRNHRIKKFKDFEKRFHVENLGASYQFTQNQSTFVYEFEPDIKVGFALINDSWRCSTCRLSKHDKKLLYFGSDQLYKALKALKGTTMNVVLTHHPLESYAEKDEVTRVLINKEFHLHLFGDKHHHSISNHMSSKGNCLCLMARAGLNKPDESEDKWQPGFHIIDINFEIAIVECIKYYMYSYDDGMFIHDGKACPRDGIDVTPRPLGFNKVTKAEHLDLTHLEETKFINND